MGPRLLPTSLVLAALVSVVACAEKKQLTQMHDATVEMRDTTKEMNGNTKEMKTTTKTMAEDTKGMREDTRSVRKSTDDMRAATENMRKSTEDMRRSTETVRESTTQVLEETKEVKDLTAELYDSARQGAAVTLRRELLESAYRSESSGKKIGELGKYFMAFEFQLWNDMGQDKGEEKRRELMQIATTEFFRDLREFATGDETVNPFAQMTAGGPVHSADNKTATVNALAVTMHILNRKQEDFIRRNPTVQPVSIYSMIADALRAEKAIDAGEVADIPAYQKDVLANKKLALFLMQARHNFAAAMFLSETVSKQGVGNKVRAFANRYFGWGASWTLDADALNVAQTEQLARYLKAVVRTRAVLNEVGVKPEVNSKIEAFLKGAKVKATAEKASGALLAARAELIELLEQSRPVAAAGAAKKP